MTTTAGPGVRVDPTRTRDIVEEMRESAADGDGQAPEAAPAEEEAPAAEEAAAQEEEPAEEEAPAPVGEAE